MNTYVSNNDEDIFTSMCGCCGMGIYLIIMFILMIILLLAMWKIFTKAGKPGWASLIPIYSTYVLFQVAYGEDNGLKFLWSFVPIINIYVSIKVYISLAKSFNKPPIYAIGLIFLPYIFMPMLAFGNSYYIGPQDTLF